MVVMPQVSLYIDQEVLDNARRRAKAKNISLSKHVNTVLSNEISSEWPTDYWSLFGSLNDDSFVISADTPFNKIEEKVSFDDLVS